MERRPLKIETEAGYAEGSTRLIIRDEKHTPWNKRVGEVESRLNIKIERNPKGEWVSLQFEEITTTENFDTGKERVASRVISVTFDQAVAERIAKHILGVL